MDFLSQKQPDFRKDALKFISKCPICSEPYNEKAAKLFAQSESAGLVHFTCKKCGGFFMTMVMEMGQGMSSVGMPTDLNFEDAKKFHNSEPISLDEALDAHGYDWEKNVF